MKVTVGSKYVWADYAVAIAAAIFLALVVGAWFGLAFRMAKLVGGF